MSFYRLKQFQCEVTGKGGLDYFQALESERQEARTMHSRFPDQLKAAVLKAVQWRTFLLFSSALRVLVSLTKPPSIHTEVMGRLDHLVEAVYDRFKDRYYPDESMSTVRICPRISIRHHSSPLTISVSEVFVDVQGDKYVPQ